MRSRRLGVDGMEVSRAEEQDNEMGFGSMRWLMGLAVLGWFLLG